MSKVTLTLPTELYDQIMSYRERGYKINMSDVFRTAISVVLDELVDYPPCPLCGNPADVDITYCRVCSSCAAKLRGE